MTADSEYVLHVNFCAIDAETAKLQQVDKELSEKIMIFLGSLKKTTARIEPTLRKETKNERELWEEYKQLQREKLAVLDLSHEWDFIDQTIKDIHPKLDFLVKDAIEELEEHIGVLAESHRAHIDILEIYNTRKIEVLALIITAVISYLAVWEFLVRDIVAGIIFPYGWSPTLNYLMIIISLLPVFSIISWAWFKRKSYF
jgi:hypothetical protein